MNKLNFGVSIFGGRTLFFGVRNMNFGVSKLNFGVRKYQNLSEIFISTTDMKKNYFGASK